MRSILYPKPVNFQLYRDAFKFIIGLSTIGVLGLIYTMCVFTYHQVSTGSAPRLCTSSEATGISSVSAVKSAAACGDRTERSRINPWSELGVRCSVAAGTPRGLLPPPHCLLLWLLAEAGGRSSGYGPPPPHCGCASRDPRCLDHRHCLCPKEAEEKEDFLHHSAED